MSDRPLKTLFDRTVGAITVGLLNGIKHTDRRRTADIAGAFMRRIGPLFPEHRIGREQLRASFPEKPADEIERILGGVWDNLGRIAIEFAHLDEFCVEGFGKQTADVITYPPESQARYDWIMKSGKAAIGFAAHLANWELPGIGATLIGVRSAVLYRRPNIGAVNDAIVKLRAPLMGELIPTGLDAPLKLARLLESGVHVGMLADQHYSKGVDVIFFGRRCLANPLIAMLARQTELPIYGMRVVRKSDGNNFWGEISAPVQPVRDATGRIDVKGTMQAITSVIEGWIRQFPEQWLWLHRRWR
jgi:Kdo2-lipid IVA lauroyltransferase/acyltransferase